MKSKLQLAKGNCGNFCNFGEMEYDLQTVKKYLRKLLYDIVLALISVRPLVLDTCVNVIGLFERRFKDLKFQRFLFCFCFCIWGKYLKQIVLYHSP